jgi:hypothetical protein
MWLESLTAALCCAAVQELPAALGRLPAVAHVDARNNQLSVLPGALGDAGSLCELRLGFNLLTSLPVSLGLLRSLKTLDLRNNLIEVRGAASICPYCALVHCHTGAVFVHPMIGSTVAAAFWDDVVLLGPCCGI